MWSRSCRNSKFIYYMGNFISYAIFKLFSISKTRETFLKNLRDEYDYENIVSRLNYYNKMDIDRIKNIPKDSKEPNCKEMRIMDSKIPKKNTVYFFDSYEFLKYFDKSLKFILEVGDVNYNLSTPSLCKSRPVSDDNYNNILLNLDKVRHFVFLKDKNRFQDKDDILYFRGGVYQAHRFRFFELYFDNPRCDIGHVGKNVEHLKRFTKPKADIKTHLKHKFILSLEGNDVATNLKWIMSSNSIAIMPKPKFETWFMEGKLIGGVHYIEIKDDYSDLFEKIDFYLKNESLCLEIIKNANKYCEQFFDKKREKLISMLVVDKYLKLKNSIQYDAIV